MIFSHVSLEFVGAGTACMYMMKRSSNTCSNPPVDRCQSSQDVSLLSLDAAEESRMMAYLRAYCFICTYLCVEADFASQPSMICSAHPFSCLHRHQPPRPTQRLLKAAVISWSTSMYPGRFRFENIRADAFARQHIGNFYSTKHFMRRRLHQPIQHLAYTELA